MTDDSERTSHFVGVVGAIVVLNQSGASSLTNLSLERDFIQSDNTQV